MTVTRVNTQGGTQDFPACEFRHVRSGLAYPDMHVIRMELSEFLEARDVAGAHAGHLLLVVTEILSNLIRHPVQKADHIEIRVSLSGTGLDLEVLDNSTPFADFNAKCESALSRLRQDVFEDEGGYGLGCILSVHKNPRYISRHESPEDLNHFRIFYDMSRETAVKTLQEHAEKKRIFLVDDDPISLQIHNRMLDQAYDVVCFESAELALKSFLDCRPDLIVSDLTMPGMDGIALRQALSKMEGGNTTPFIFLSGHSEREHSSYINQLGVDNFLCKPVTSESLNTVLTRLLQRSQQVRASMHGQFSQDITELLKPALVERYGGWNFSVRYQTADAGGGDFIFHQQTDTNITGVLADVMGHGKQAKFFSCVYAGYLHSMFRMQAQKVDAASFLKRLSAAIEGDPLLENMVMTCQCFQFFPAGVLKVSSAGHPPPIIVRPHGAGLANVTGPLPGIISDHDYDLLSLRIDHGEKVLFMTDGFMEAFDRHGDAAQKILELIDFRRDMSAAGLADCLWKDFQERQQEQTANRDDATIIVAEYGGEA